MGGDLGGAGGAGLGGLLDGGDWRGAVQVEVGQRGAELGDALLVGGAVAGLDVVEGLESGTLCNEFRTDELGQCEHLRLVGRARFYQAQDFGFRFALHFGGETALMTQVDGADPT